MYSCVKPHSLHQGATSACTMQYLCRPSYKFRWCCSWRCVAKQAELHIFRLMGYSHIVFVVTSINNVILSNESVLVLVLRVPLSCKQMKGTGECINASTACQHIPCVIVNVNKLTAILIYAGMIALLGLRAKLMCRALGSSALGPPQTKALGAVPPAERMC